MTSLGNDTLIPESQRQEYWEECRDFIEKYAIWKMGPWPWSLPIPAKQPKDVKNKKYYSWQFYIAKATGDYNINHKLSILALDALLPVWKKKKFQLAGLESDGIPIAMGMLYAAQEFETYKGLTMFRVRKEYKEYGLKNIIEGRVVSRKPVLMVDDLVSSKETAYHAWWRLKNNEKMKISDSMFAIIQKNIKQEDPGIDKRKDYTGTKDMISVDTYSIKTINLFYLDDFSVGDMQTASKAIIDGIEKNTD